MKKKISNIKKIKKNIPFITVVMEGFAMFVV